MFVSVPVLFLVSIVFKKMFSESTWGKLMSKRATNVENAVKHLLTIINTKCIYLLTPRRQHFLAR